MNRRIRSYTVVAVVLLLGAGTWASAQESQAQQAAQAKPDTQHSAEQPGGPEVIRPQRSPQFDPHTDEPIRPDRSPQFDPHTDEPIRPERSPQFDPNVGEPIRPERSSQFDPQVDEPIRPEQSAQFHPGIGEPIGLEEARMVDPQTEEAVEPVFRPDELDAVQPAELHERTRHGLEKTRAQALSLVEDLDELQRRAARVDGTAELPSQRRLEELAEEVGMLRLRVYTVRIGLDRLGRPEDARQTGRLFDGLDTLQEFLGAYGLVLVRRGNRAQFANDLELDIQVLEKWLNELPELEHFDDGR